MNKKLSQYLPLTKRELKEFFASYRQAFPAWEVENDVVLTRRHGPVKQIIYFEGLRYAAYRPGHSIELLIVIPGGCTLLQQHLDVKHREVERRQHSTKFSLVLKAMEDQFLPSIRKPLDVAETLWFAEEEADRDHIENINNSTALAVLNAYLGNSERACYWCDRVEQTAAQTRRPLADWEIRTRLYAIELQNAVKHGKEHDFLS